MSHRDRITIEPGKRGGKPCIRGQRITVGDILEYLAGGMTEAELLSEFPYLEHEDVRISSAEEPWPSPTTSEPIALRASTDS